MDYHDKLYLKMFNPEMTKETAQELFDSKWWESVALARAAWLQLNQKLLCMPFDKFHEAVEFLLGRPVYTHEFAFAEHLKQEVLTGKSPSFEEILDLLPEYKLIVIEVKD